MIQILLVVVAVLITSISLTVFPDPRWVLVGLLAGLILAGIFRQLIPLFISTRNPEGTLLFLMPVVRPFFPIMTFIADPFQSLFDRSRRKDQVTEIGEETEQADDSDDLQALIDVGAAEGILEEEEGELIHSIIEFGDTRVSEAMTPRPDIVSVPTTASVREAREIMLESKYSRLPVYRDHMYSLLNATNLKKHYQLEWAGKIVRRFRSIAPKYNTSVDPDLCGFKLPNVARRQFPTYQPFAPGLQLNLPASLEQLEHDVP